jgi:hypothetical protein
MTQLELKVAAPRRMSAFLREYRVKRMKDWI